MEVPKGEKASSPDTPKPKIRISSVFTYISFLITHKKDLGYTGEDYFDYNYCNHFTNEQRMTDLSPDPMLLTPR